MSKWILFKNCYPAIFGTFKENGKTYTLAYDTPNYIPGRKNKIVKVKL